MLSCLSDDTDRLLLSLRLSLCFSELNMVVCRLRDESVRLGCSGFGSGEMIAAAILNKFARVARA